MGIKKTFFAGNKEPFTHALQRIMGTESIWVSEQNFEAAIQAEDPKTTLFILNTVDDISAQVIKWLWNKLRLNEERLGRRIAGLPVLVFGMNRKFLETPEGKVFRDFPVHHQYFTKPLNLHKFLVALGEVSPVDYNSLGVIKQDAPSSLLGALEHDLKSIYQKFNYGGADEEIKRRFHDVEINLSNYQFLEKNNKRVQKVREEVEKLKDEIINRGRKLWE